MDFGPTVVAAGNLATFTDVLRDEAGVAVDLTGATVRFAAQCGAVGFVRDAEVVEALTGKVRYAAQAGDLDTPGEYAAQWQVTFPDQHRQVFPFPAGDLGLQVQATLPVAAPPNVTLISDTFELVRAILGDLNSKFRRFEDSAIASVVRTMVRLGRMDSNIPYTLTANGQGITPAVTSARDLALLTYHAALTFAVPEAAEYSYRTRALSERFGNQKYFLFELKNLIYDTENDGGVFHTFQSFYGWVNATTGLNIWCVMTDMQTKAPVATVTISRAGITVNRT